MFLVTFDFEHAYVLTLIWVGFLGVRFEVWGGNITVQYKTR